MITGKESPKKIVITDGILILTQLGIVDKIK